MHPDLGSSARPGSLPAAAAPAPRHGFGDWLTIGFGATVAMWGIGYVCRLPHAPLPASVLFGLVLGALCAAGFLGGRYAARGAGVGWRAGLLCGGLNTLVLGSVLGKSITSAALVWVPGSILATALAMWLCAAIGARLRPRTPRTEPDWPAHFATVAVAAVLLLLMIGGAVTGFDAGLAVVDWPNSEGYFMFLYPLARMTGGIYYEHAHRMFGGLVGLTTLALAVLVQHERRGAPWLRQLAWFAFLIVCVQGTLGGLRVTGHLTLSTSPDETRPSIVLAVLHGVLAQLFFCLLISLRVLLGGRWRSAAPAAVPPDRALPVLLVFALVIQLILGALLRHMQVGLWLHLGFALVVTALACSAGLRAWARQPEGAPLAALGNAVLLIVSLQVLLGFVALMVTADDAPGVAPRPWEVIFTTAHQTTGAMLLATSVMLALWSLRHPAARTDAAIPDTTAARAQPRTAPTLEG